MLGTATPEEAAAAIRENGQYVSGKKRDKRQQLFFIPSFILTFHDCSTASARKTSAN